MSNLQLQNTYSAPPNVQKAVTFFKQVGLSRFLTKLREKYIEVGHVGGQILLQESTPGERREIASFLARSAYKSADIRVKLVDVDNALSKSAFACTLPELFAAFFPDQPLITKQMQRAAQMQQRSHFYQELLAVAMALPEETQGRIWLMQGFHGLEWLFSRYKNSSNEIQQQQLTLVRYVAKALNQLPPSHAPEQLALFAQRTSGDPHMLDDNRPAGRLFLLALNDLAQSATRENTATKNLLSSTSPNNRAQELRLYNNLGLLVDTISSSVAVFNLVHALYHGGVPDPLISAANGRVLLLPMRQLLEWQSVHPVGSIVYVVENPQVFEEMISGLDGLRSTLICTSGWPSVAATMLLDLILADSLENQLYYSGDFDAKGLQIASYLMARYPNRCHPWHFDPASYTQAMHAGGNPASATDISSLNTLPAIFAPLLVQMQEHKIYAYQEGIAHLLLEDVQLHGGQYS